MTEKLRWIRLAALVGLGLAFCVHWSQQITDRGVEKDAMSNLRMGINLRHNHVMSLAEHAPYVPTMYREPVPVLSTALFVGLTDMALGWADTEEYYAGERLKYVKYQNIFWMALLCFGTFWAIHLFTSSVLLCILGVILVNVKLPLLASGLGYEGLRINDLYSDLPAAAMLVIGCAALGSGLRREQKSMVVLAGLSFGVLALTKAAFLYVFAVMPVVLLCLFVWRRRLPGHTANPVQVGILVAAFAAVVLPWMYRNYTTFGHFKISERGGLILLIRAEKDKMTSEEVRGSFYAWAPGRLQPLVGAVLGFSPRDLQKGGRLQRLNRSRTSGFYSDDLEAEFEGAPEHAISLYRRARAQRTQLERKMRIGGGVPSSMAADDAGPKVMTLAKYAGGGGVDSSVAVDEVLAERALAIIRDQPLRHFAMTIPFLWRGGLVTFPIFAVALAYAVWVRRYDVVAFVLPAFGLVMFYATLSHFIPRYGVPVVPVAVVSGLVLTSALWDVSIKRVKDIKGYTHL